jgi:hypothetical protein
VAAMQKLIKEGISDSDRRSAQEIEPLSDVELPYLYAATQGS